jgi:hypothetical protein
MDYTDAYDISSIQLEPRLQEYTRRKNFNKENNIEPAIKEEKEFDITQHDLKIIKRFQQGKKKIYSSSRMSKHPDLIEPEKGSFEDQDSELDFKKDPRYERLKKKMQSHKTAQQQIRNLEGLNEEYTIFHQSNPYDMKPQNRPQRISKPYFDSSGNGNLSNDDDQYDNIMMDSHDMMRQPIGKNKQSKHHSESYYCNPAQNSSSKPKHAESYDHSANSSHKQRLSTNHAPVSGGIKHSRDIKEIIGDMDSYNHHLSDTYDYVNDRNAEVDTGRFVSGNGSKSCRDNQTTYRSIPLGYSNGLADISIEDSLRGGITDTGRRSSGFKNPFEHQFSYISRDISDYRNTVNIHPQNSRGQNKEIARPHSASARANQNEIREFNKSNGRR